MADIKVGDPKTSKDDLKAVKKWQDDRPAYADIVAAGEARKARISEFEKEQSAKGGDSLGEALEWLEEREPETLAKRVRKIWKALSADRSVFRIGGNLLPKVHIVQPDSSPPIEPFDASDVVTVCNSPMYKDPRALRALIGRLWAPRDVLQKLFQQNDLPLPPFWVEAPPNLPHQPQIGKIPLLVEYLETNFPWGVPDPAKANRQMLARDLIDAIPALQKSLDPKTLKKAIDQHNQKVSQKQRTR